MNKIEMQKEFQDFLKENNINYKPNPNKYPIIDKWNYKYQYKPNQRIINEKLEELIDKQIYNIFLKEMNRVLHVEVNIDEPAFRNEECNLCNGDGYTSHEYKPKMIQDGWE